MANAYQIKRDTVFPRVVSVIEREGQEPFYETIGVSYAAGQTILALNMTPRDQERAASGALDHLIEAIPGDVDVQEAGVESSMIGAFIPEHEAEAHALAQSGHIVIPREQVLRALSSGADYKRDYQQAVKDAGLDRRPAQEHYAERRDQEVLPDEALIGSETRSGMPHNAGPIDDGSEPDEAEADAPPVTGATPPRARPGS